MGGMGKLPPFVMLLAAVIAGVLVWGLSRDPNAISEQKLPSLQVPTVAPSSSVHSGEWHKVASWSGSGIKSTEAFSVSGRQWRVKWSFRSSSDIGAIMQIFVEKPGEDLPIGLAANTTNERGGADVSYFDGPGEFRLNMNCANADWKVEVEEER